MLGGSKTARRLDMFAIVVLVGWLTFDLTARTLFGSVPWPNSVIDYRIQYDAGHQLLETHHYPEHHPYPPPAMAFQASTTVFSFPTAAAIWLPLTGLAATVSYLAFARTLNLFRRPGALIVLPLAHFVVAYYFQWDMRSVNCNLLMLAAILFGCAALSEGRDAAAGGWFAASIALKLFPFLVLPYLMWTRRWRAFGWAVAFSLVFWIGVPLVAFGSGFADVYAGWVGELTRATDPSMKHAHPILISLEKAAPHATSTASAARAVILGVCGLWVCIGLAGAAACWGTRPRDGYAIVAHVSLLVLGPLAVNPYLEPYHLVLLVAPAGLLIAAAIDSRLTTRVRLVAAVGFILGMAILKASSPWEVRGLLVNAQAIALCSAAVWVAWARTSIAAAATETPVRRVGLVSILRWLFQRQARFSGQSQEQPR